MGIVVFLYLRASYISLTLKAISYVISYLKKKEKSITYKILARSTSLINIGIYYSSNIFLNQILLRHPTIYSIKLFFKSI